MRQLLPYVWPANRPDLRRRVVFALLALIAAKAITLGVPIAYKTVTPAPVKPKGATLRGAMFAAVLA